MDYHANSNEKCCNYENSEKTKNAMETELVVSKRYIEYKLNKNVIHFCFPWFVASFTSAAMAKESGYQNIHLGAQPDFRVYKKKGLPVLINLVQEEYLFVLP